MTAPTQWSPDNPFAPKQESTDTFSDDNPFVQKAPAPTATAAPEPFATPLAAPEAPQSTWPQSDIAAGVGAGTGGLISGTGHFLNIFDLNELGDPLIQAGNKVSEFSQQAFQPKVTSYKQVHSIADAADYLQFQLGQGLPSMLPSVGAAKAVAGAGRVAQTIAAIAPSYVQNTGDIMEELNKMGKGDQKKLALVLGVPISALDAITPLEIAHIITAKKITKAAAQSLLKEIGKTAGQEGLTEGLQEEIQYFGTRSPTGQPTNLRDAIDRGVDAAVGGAITGGFVRGLAGSNGRGQASPPKTVDPTTLKPPASPPGQPTASDVNQKQKEVDALAQAEKELAEQKAKSKNSLLRAANAWNTLSADQRRAVVGGMADDQYSRRWVDLSTEAKVAVKKALIPPESDTNSYTSPDAQTEATGSVPSAQGVGPEATTPTVEPPPVQEGQGSTAVKEEPHAGDISYMDLPTLRAERERADAKLQQMDIQNDSPTLQEGAAHEREFWQKYKNDLESAMVKKMGPGSTTPESAAKNAPADEGPDIAPDMPPGVSRYDVRKYPENDQVVVHIYDEHGNISETHGPISREEATKRFPKAKLPKSDAEMIAEQDALERQGKTVPRKDEDIITQQRTVAGDTEELLRLASKGEQDQATTEAINDLTGDKKPTGPGDKVQLHDGRVGTVESVQGQRYVVKIGDELINVSGAQLNNYVEPKSPVEGKVVGKIEPKPDAGATPPLQSGGPGSQAPTEPEATKGTQGPTPGGSEATTKGTDETTQANLDRVIKIKQQLSSAEARKKARTARRGLWAEKTPAQIEESIKKDKKLVEDLTKELDELLSKLSDDQRTELADRVSTKDAIGRQLDKQMEKLAEQPRTINEAQKLTTKLLEKLSVQREDVVSKSSEMDYARAIEDRLGNPNSDPSKHGVPPKEFNELWKVMKELEEATHHLMDLQRAAGVSEDQIGTHPNDMVLDYTEEMTPELMDQIDQEQIDKLVNEPPPNTLELKYRESLNKMDLDQLDEQIDKARKLYDEQKISDADYRTLINDIADAKKSLKAKEMPKSVIPPKFNMPDTYNKDLSKFNNDQLSAAKRSLASMIQSDEAKTNPKLLTLLKAELNRMLDYDSEQRRKKEGGFLRLWKQTTVKKADQSALPHYEQTLAKRIGLEEDPVNPYTVMDQIRRAYARIFRQAHGIYVAEKLAPKQLAAHNSPSIMAQLSNGWLVQTEEFERGNGPFIPDGQGGFNPTGAMPLNQIAGLVGDDVERLGWLALARRELWERAQKNRTIGLDPVASQLMYVNTPDIYHKAADALAEYMHSLVDYSIWGGLVDPAKRSEFTSRFYAPIERLFGNKIEGAGPSNITPRGQKKKGIGVDNPIKRYKGSTERMRNPYETAMNMTARTIRAANQNYAALVLADLATEFPDHFLGVMEPASAAQRNKIRAELRAEAEAKKKELGDDGQDLSISEIEHFLGTMGDKALSIRDNILNVVRKGKLEHWVLQPELAYAMKSLSPHEMAILFRLAGVPAQVQRSTIVNHPSFILTMSMIDTFQAAINSQNGFVPVVSSFKGWWAAVNNEPEFVNYRRGGGGNASLTSHQYAKASTSLSDVVGAPESQKPMDQALHQLRTMHPLKAWRTLVNPVAEAARVGEYLAARGRGATVVEAVYAAKNVVGDYSQMGGAMHELSHMALFLNPALQVLATTAKVIKRNPAQWFLRSSLLGVAAFGLYMANDDDDEIRDLRQTPGGQRYLFIRLPNGEIIKIRKPYLEGAIFMSGIEAAMDQMKGENPEAFKLWRTAVIQELKMNMLPTIGVIPAQLWANKDWQNDAPIVPENDQEMSPMFQARGTTGTAARIIGKTFNKSPAVIEWLARSQFGYIGADGLAAMEAAINWRMSGEMPIPEELPFLNKVLVRYPSSNVRPIRDFYDRAKKIEQTAADIEYMANHEPEMLEHYLESHQKEMMLAETWQETRKELSDYRKAIEDVTSAPPDVIPPSTKHVYSDELLRVMIETARAANLVHDAITESTQ